MSKWSTGVSYNCSGHMVVSSDGIRMAAVSNDAAEAIVRVLNSLEDRASYAEQCVQDSHENAYVEATVHKQLVRAASAAVIAFGSDTEGDAIQHLGQVLCGNVYSIIPG